ncbi:MAG: HAD family hydrolase [Dehalococcoidia bacterium]
MTIPLIPGINQRTVRIRAVLFDVGGPIDLETAFEAAIDADIKAGLEREGFGVDDETWAAANRHAVAFFAPSLYRSVIWQLTGGDEASATRVYDWVEAQADGRTHFELRPGIDDVLKTLRARGLKLGLVANQPLRVLDLLQQHGVGDYFTSNGISALHGFRKPDVRLFLRTCEELGVPPESCIMVGDRIDNDIAPAKLLGMRTVLIRTGRHREQQPRSWDERPDREVVDAAGILRAVVELVEEGIDHSC